MRSSAHIAVDRLGHPLALHVTPANAQELVAVLAETMHEATGRLVEVASVDPGHTLPASHDATQRRMKRVKLPLDQAERRFFFPP